MLKANKKVWIIFILLLVIIWGHSCMPGDVSSTESGWVMTNIINPVLNAIGLDSLEHGLIRKLGHVTEFTLLGMAALCLWRGAWPRAMFTGFTAAFLDESIQLLSGRGAQIQDVWIDLIGVTLGSGIAWLIWRLRRRKGDSRGG